MTIEEAKELLPIIKAYSEGKQVQYKLKGSCGWVNLHSSEELTFNPAKYDYRIKPESMYRPFKNAEECFKAVKEHGSWVKHKYSGYYHQITNICDGEIHLGHYSDYSFKEILEKYIWANDESPFGVEEG